MDVNRLITELRLEREEIEQAIRSAVEKRIHLVAKIPDNDIEKACDGSMPSIAARVSTMRQPPLAYRPKSSSAGDYRILS